MARSSPGCALLLVVLGCGSEAPTRTTSPTPPPQRGTYTLSGTVSEEAGAAVEGADVYVGRDPRWAGFGAATTDAQGHYVVSGLFAGKQPVYVSKSGYLGVSDTVEIGEHTIRNFTLRPGVIVRGRTMEAGVGPLIGATITVISGPNVGVQTTSAAPLGGFWLPAVLPGDFTIRASKPGYDSVERTVHAPPDTYVDITMKWAYGSCLTSVSPVVFDRVPASGTTADVAVLTQGARAWTATPTVPWVSVLTNTSAGGSATLQFRVQPNPIGAVNVRSGAIEIRCGSETGGQNIWITQMVDCQARIEPDASTPRVFPPEGGSGRLMVRFGVPGCHSRDYSDVDWMFIAGVSSYISGQVHFSVLRNDTGLERAGDIVVGETRWTVRQDR